MFINFLYIPTWLIPSVGQCFKKYRYQKRFLNFHLQIINKVQEYIKPIYVSLGNRILSTNISYNISKYKTPSLENTQSAHASVTKGNED